ncbi:MAG: hypothetical protein ABEI75_02540 [Halobaculum sp.]
MRRRTALYTLGLFGAAATAGCSEVWCPNGEDVVTLEQVTEATATSEGAVLVKYRRLGPSAQRAVRRAVRADDDYRVCHRKGGEASAIERLAEHVRDRTERQTGPVYLRYDGTYYEVSIGLQDVGVA